MGTLGIRVYDCKKHKLEAARNVDRNSEDASGLHIIGTGARVYALIAGQLSKCPTFSKFGKQIQREKKIKTSGNSHLIMKIFHF